MGGPDSDLTWHYQGAWENASLNRTEPDLDSTKPMRQRRYFTKNALLVLPRLSSFQPSPAVARMLDNELTFSIHLVVCVSSYA
jgi:hypothetical protein